MLHTPVNPCPACQPALWALCGAQEQAQGPTACAPAPLPACLRLQPAAPRGRDVREAVRQLLDAALRVPPPPAVPTNYEGLLRDIQRWIDDLEATNSDVATAQQVRCGAGCTAGGPGTLRAVPAGLPPPPPSAPGIPLLHLEACTRWLPNPCTAPLPHLPPLQETRRTREENEAQKAEAEEDVFDDTWHRLAWLRCGGHAGPAAAPQAQHPCCCATAPHVPLRRLGRSLLAPPTAGCAARLCPQPLPHAIAATCHLPLPRPQQGVPAGRGAAA